jgi:hypothetical protein
VVSVNEKEILLPSHLYALQRANGDVFALDDHGRFRVPLFQSKGDATLARLRNVEMLLFKPVTFDARLLKQIIPLGDAAEVDFWLVNDPLINLNRGRLVHPTELDLLVGSRMRPKAVPRDPTIDEVATLATSPYSNSNATAA